uniref:Uncharacterized protein n=1 Tax=Onchocerca volvulus TaxID=6282 RepID=A0A8R1XS66_ONCVO
MTVANEKCCDVQQTMNVFCRLFHCYSNAKNHAMINLLGYSCNINEEALFRQRRDSTMSMKSSRKQKRIMRPSVIRRYDYVINS